MEVKKYKPHMIYHWKLSAVRVRPTTNRLTRYSFTNRVWQRIPRPRGALDLHVGGGGPIHDVAPGAPIGGHSGA